MNSRYFVYGPRVCADRQLNDLSKMIGRNQKYQIITYESNNELISNVLHVTASTTWYKDMIESVVNILGSLPAGCLCS